MSKIIEKFKYEITKNFNFIFHHKIGIAVSGGPDSVALLLLFYSIKELRDRLVVLHFDHRLRKSSSEDREFVKNLAKGLRLSFLAGSQDVESFHINAKLSLEEAARIARYDFFEHAAKIASLDYIALAHNADEQAETILLRITRGSGLTGLSGIPGKRGIFIRPLLSFPKSDLIAFLNEKNQSYSVDPTNSDTKITRNYIRAYALPVLKKLNPNLPVTIYRSSVLLSKENEFINNRMLELLKFFNRRADFWEIRQEVFLDFEEVLRFRLINFLYMKVTGSFYNPPLNFTENCMRVTEKVNGMSSYNSFKMVVSCGYIAFMREKERFSVDMEMNIGNKVRVDSVTLKADYHKKSELFCRYDYEKNSNTLYFDLHKTKGKIYLRNIKNGDRFIPFGHNSPVKVFRFLMKKKIPSYFRDFVYALCDREGIIAIVPVQIAGRVKTDTESKKIIKIDWEIRSLL